MARAMLTDELVAASGEDMATTMIRQKALIALFAALATSACTAERSLAPSRSPSPISASATQIVPQVPLLYVVDGVRLVRDYVPAISAEQIASVRLIRGHRALEEFGPDASNGVVIIRTKLSTRRT